jgi:hypothetical protein
VLFCCPKSLIYLGKLGSSPVFPASTHLALWFSVALHQGQPRQSVPPEYTSLHRELAQIWHKAQGTRHKAQEIGGGHRAATRASRKKRHRGALPTALPAAPASAAIDPLPLCRSACCAALAVGVAGAVVPLCGDGCAAPVVPTRRARCRACRPTCCAVGGRGRGRALGRGATRRMDGVAFGHTSAKYPSPGWRKNFFGVAKLSVLPPSFAVGPCRRSTTSAPTRPAAPQGAARRALWLGRPKNIRSPGALTTTLEGQQLDGVT